MMFYFMMFYQHRNNVTPKKKNKNHHLKIHILHMMLMYLLSKYSLFTEGDPIGRTNLPWGPLLSLTKLVGENGIKRKACRAFYRFFATSLTRVINNLYVKLPAIFLVI